MVDKKKLDTCINGMIELMMEMKRSLKEDETPQDNKRSLGNNPVNQKKTIRSAPRPKPVQETSNISTFKEIKEAVLSDKWPEAVNKNLICDPYSEDDKLERGRGIIELMIEEDLKDLRMLDIGCGEGHCISITPEYHIAQSVGYDTKEHNTWRKFESEKSMFTTDFNQVKDLGPYNVILIFDTIDHLQGESMESLLTKAASVLAKDGRIYMRAHPFTSRHATHLYHDLNKAYLHLVFSEEELKQLIPRSEHELESQKVTRPLATYGEAIGKSGLKEINRREITEKVEPFFTSPEIAKRIQDSLGFDTFPNFQLSLQFIDYVLGSK